MSTITNRSEDEIFDHLVDNPGWSKNAEQYISRWRKLHTHKVPPDSVVEKYQKMSKALLRYREWKKVNKEV